MLLKRALLVAHARRRPCPCVGDRDRRAVRGAVGLLRRRGQRRRAAYSLPASLRGSGAVGAQLGALVQLETMLSIAKFGSIGVTQLVGDARDECTPEIVLDKLTGQQSGARETMKSGQRPDSDLGADLRVGS